MRNIRRRSTRITNDPAYTLAVSGYESLQRETQNRQQLMIFSIAPFLATWRVSTQKSAEGIVVSRKLSGDEGPNAEVSEAIP